MIKKIVFGFLYSVLCSNIVFAVDVEPGRLELTLPAGSDHKVSFKLSNRTSEIMVIGVSSGDYRFLLSENSVLPKGKNPNQLIKHCKGWISSELSNLVVNPAEEKEVFLNIKVPQNAKGEYAACLILDQVSEVKKNNDVVGDALVAESFGEGGDDDVLLDDDPMFSDNDSFFTDKSLLKDNESSNIDLSPDNEALVFDKDNEFNNESSISKLNNSDKDNSSAKAVDLLKKQKLDLADNDTLLKNKHNEPVVDNESSDNSVSTVHDEAQLDVDLKVVYRRSVPIYVFVDGTTKIDGKITGVSFESVKDDMQIENHLSRLKIETTLKNTGSRHIRLKGTIVIMNSKGEVVDTLSTGKTLPIFPSVSEIIPVYWKCPKVSAEYTAVITLDLGDNNIAQTTKSFSTDSEGFVVK